MGMEQDQRLESSDDPLLKWIHWVDRAIEAAQERGDFDNLPGHGKPLVIDETPYAGDRALGFHVLTNAGVKPIWMEIDKEIHMLRASMQKLLDRLSDEPPIVTAGTNRPRRSSKLTWLRRLTDRGGKRTAGARSYPSRSMARSRVRREYRRLASDLDEKIRLYNHALPPELRHLERIRPSEDEAARYVDDVLERTGGGHTDVQRHGT